MTGGIERVSTSCGQKMQCLLINFTRAQAGLHNTDRVFVAIFLPARLEPLHTRSGAPSQNEMVVRGLVEVSRVEAYAGTCGLADRATARTGLDLVLHRDP